MDFQANGYVWKVEEIAINASIVYTNRMIIYSMIFLDNIQLI